MRHRRVFVCFVLPSELDYEIVSTGIYRQNGREVCLCVEKEKLNAFILKNWARQDKIHIVHDSRIAA